MEHDEEAEYRTIVREEREELMEKLLSEVTASRKGLEKAKKRWYDAVLAAHNAGATNGQIGGRADITEAAIRLFIKRESGPRK